MPFSCTRAFNWNLLNRMTFISIPKGSDNRLSKTIPADPAQYNQLIFLRLRQINRENFTGLRYSSLRLARTLTATILD